MAQRTASVRTSRGPSRQSRNPIRRTASSQTRNEVGRRLTGYILRFAVNRVVEQRRHRKGKAGHEGDHGGSAMGHAVTNALLEELISEVVEFIVRHNFFMGNKNANLEEGEQDSAKGAQSGDSQPQEPSQSSQHSSADERRRHRYQRRSEAMMHSLDRLSDELETTYDATVRVLRESGNGAKANDKIEEGGKPQETTDNPDESLRENLENLRRATTRCMARVESVRRSHHGSRRVSRQRRSEKNSRLSRSGSAMTGA